MLAKRIIPCLDVSGGRVVKGVHFLDLKDAGDPVELGRRYYREGADELVFLDITATVEERKTVVDWVKRVADSIFIPFTVGGGISTVSHVHDLLRAGADKVSINSAAVRNPDLLREASLAFGSQCIVLAVDAKRAQANWKQSAMPSNGFVREKSSRWEKSFSPPWTMMAPRRDTI